jgi:hypothetical protein
LDKSKHSGGVGVRHENLHHIPWSAFWQTMVVALHLCSCLKSGIGTHIDNKNPPDNHLVQYCLDFSGLGINY